uniref:Uncharacterized protein n=1 Tax=Thermosporothrix sp. COM3 TaxID=2490863 RepID=A0A455SSN5_9CHLR|nr:hypothetical protein KTC_46630 [Thermosporothrix sp. COM3]
MEQQRISPKRRLRIFERAVWNKSNRYIWSGLLFVILGLLLIGAGIVFSGGVYYSPEGLLIGIGAIVFIVGIIRLLIGMINPPTPEDLPPLDEEEETTRPNDEISLDDLYRH